MHVQATVRFKLLIQNEIKTAKETDPFVWDFLTRESALSVSFQGDWVVLVFSVKSMIRKRLHCKNSNLARVIFLIYNEKIHHETY